MNNLNIYLILKLTFILNQMNKVNSDKIIIVIFNYDKQYKKVCYENYNGKIHLLEFFSI